MSYQHINIRPKAFPLELILDSNSATNKAIKYETKLANAAPELKKALEEIKSTASIGSSLLARHIKQEAERALNLVRK